MDSKQALRRAAERRRTSLAPLDLSLVVEELTSRASRIASYLAVGSEPRVVPRSGWLLPVLCPDDDLDWSVYDGQLAVGRRGLQEPVGERLGVEAVASCDLVLVPALLVDRRGYRLGKGGGSYDRALSRAKGTTVALIYDGELVETLPSEQHDVPVHAVVTPARGVVRLPERM